MNIPSNFVRTMWTVMKKELLGHIRDRRSILAALVLPIFGPLVFAITFTGMASWLKEKPMEIPVQGIAFAPSLMRHLQSEGISTYGVDQSPEALVKSGKVPVGLIVSEDFGKNLTEGMPANITIVSDGSRSSSAKSVRRVHTALAIWSGKVGTLRLLARGVDPKLAQPALISDLDVATPAERAAQMLSMIPLFLMMTAFIGGQNLVIDMIAGERERGSLESLLMTSASRTCLALGKWIVASVTSLAVTLLCLFGFALALTCSPLEELGVSFSLGLKNALELVLILTPLAAVGAAIELAVSTYARSIKEAQTWLGFFSLLPAIPAIVVLFSPFDSARWMTAIPILAQQTLTLDVFKMNPVLPSNLAIVWGSSLLISAAFLFWTDRLLHRESIIYGR